MSLQHLTLGSLTRFVQLVNTVPFDPLEDAVGVRIKDLPITAEKVSTAMRLEKSK